MAHISFFFGRFILVTQCFLGIIPWISFIPSFFFEARRGQCFGGNNKSYRTQTNDLLSPF
jgi:hypothetical protein